MKIIVFGSISWRKKKKRNCFYLSQKWKKLVEEFSTDVVGEFVKHGHEKNKFKNLQYRCVQWAKNICKELEYHETTLRQQSAHLKVAKNEK